MRVGIISQWYPPEPEFLVSGLAQGLATRGHEVRVLTGFPNYPGGRLYPGHRQRWPFLDESAGPIAVRRVPLYPSHDSSMVRRAGNYLSFAASSAIGAARYLSNVDVIYVYHPPATAFAGAALLRLLRRIPSVLHVQDLWPESVTESAMAPSGVAGKLLGRGLSGAMRTIYRTAASIAVIAPAMREMVIARGAQPDKVRVVYNWTDEENFRPVEPSEQARHALGDSDRCIIMYAGNIGPFQNITGAIRAAASVEHRGSINLAIVGSGIAERPARALASELGAGNVRFLGQRSPAEMVDLYAAADYSLISLRDLPIFRGTIPSKLQAAFSCASPVIAAVAGDCADIVCRTGAGFACAPEDSDALAQGFLDAAALPPTQRREMGRRGHESYHAQMSRERGVDQLEEMLLAAARRS